MLKFQQYEADQKEKFKELELSLNKTIENILTSATDTFQASLQHQLENMTQSMKTMQQTLLEQFRMNLPDSSMKDSQNLRQVTPMQLQKFVPHQAQAVEQDIQMELNTQEQMAYSSLGGRTS